MPWKLGSNDEVAFDSLESFEFTTQIDCASPDNDPNRRTSLSFRELIEYANLLEGNVRLAVRDWNRWYENLSDEFKTHSMVFEMVSERMNHLAEILGTDVYTRLRMKRTLQIGEHDGSKT